jgi:uncharacterized protein (TIGR00266 family)
VASADGAVGIPIDFDTASKIVGSESQIAVIELEPGQILRAESGAMMYMTDGVEMSTTTGGGLSSGFKRMLTGQNFFISDYTYNGPEGTKGTVALGTDFPSKILRLNLEDCGGKVVCQKGALLCASHTVNVEMEFTKNIKSGFFGGEGFVLQALTGQGDVFVKAGGTLIRRDLKEGETLRASAGCLVAFVDAGYGKTRLRSLFVRTLIVSTTWNVLISCSSSFPLTDVQMVQGFTNVIAGGEGLFMTTFTGPGTVWLQGQPPQRMVSEIARRVPSGGGIGLAVPVPGMGGGGGGDGGGGGGGEPTQG